MVELDDILHYRSYCVSAVQTSNHLKAPYKHIRLQFLEVLGPSCQLDFMLSLISCRKVQIKRFQLMIGKLISLD